MGNAFHAPGCTCADKYSADVMEAFSETSNRNREAFFQLDEKF
jgi:hypothetical protein